jgi:predicted glycogen debranching enzyme
MKISRGSFKWEPEWHYMVHRTLEAERGLDPDSDLYSPGYFSCQLTGNEGVELTAHIENGPKPAPISNKDTRLKIFFDPSKNKTDFNPIELLERALDDYIAKRGALKTVIAGYPWFLDWGRDALIFSRGLIAAGKTGVARKVLKLLGRFEENGTLPNMIRGVDTGNRDTSDAPLWFFTACADLVRKEGNDDFLDETYNDRSIRDILVSIARALITGTPNGIYIDPDSGLIFNPAHFTWMDTNHPAGTPREGFPIEIQALWSSALAFLTEFEAPTRRSEWEQLASKVKASIQERYWLKQAAYLSDCLHIQPGGMAHQAEPDDALRPNQLLAITLGAVTDLKKGRQILAACEELLVPGAIRSLADRPVHRPLPIKHNGKIINDPTQPYQGRYNGDEDMARKPAYHNGTAWTWLFPSYCEAWAEVYGENGRNTALAWLTSSAPLLRSGCVGHLPEILDGDSPHTSRGCDAQAWACSEWVRVWLKLSSPLGG